MTVFEFREQYINARTESERLIATIAEKEQQMEELRQEEEQINLMYQKAQADKANIELMLKQMERMKYEIQLLQEKEGMETEFNRKEEEAGELLRREHIQRLLLKEKEARFLECKEKQNKLTEIYQNGRALEVTEHELKIELAEMDHQAKCFENYEKTRNTYLELLRQIAELEAAPEHGRDFAATLDKLTKEAELEKATMELLLEQTGIRADAETLDLLIVKRRERQKELQATLAEVEEVLPSYYFLFLFHL